MSPHREPEKCGHVYPGDTIRDDETQCYLARGHHTTTHHGIDFARDRDGRAHSLRYVEWVE